MNKNTNNNRKRKRSANGRFMTAIPCESREFLEENFEYPEYPENDNPKPGENLDDENPEQENVDDIVEEINNELGIEKNTKKKMPFWLKVALLIGAFYILKKMFG